MNIIKYVGMDVHKSVTVIAVLDEQGQIISMSKVRTKTDPILEFFRGLSGQINVVLEEGNWSNWLYALIKPLVSAIMVCETRQYKLNGNGNKTDEIDAQALAERLRMGDLKAVYKGDDRLRQMRDLFRAYANLVEDSTRVMNRIKAIYRGRGIDCNGPSVFRLDQRPDWLAKLPDQAVQFRTQTLMKELDTLQELRKEAKTRLITEAKQSPDYKFLVSIPSIGAVRAASLLAIVGRPERFRTKRQFWPYCGFAVVVHTSSEFIEIGGQIIKKQKKTSTRGLNRNHHPFLKGLFKGAAITILQDAAWRAYYDQMIEKKKRPEMARLSIARKIAAVTLAVWQQHEDYDQGKVFSKA